jgi:hypothetical protein
VHAKVICPDSVRLFSYPDMGDYAAEENVFLVFPGTNFAAKNWPKFMF